MSMSGRLAAGLAACAIACAPAHGQSFFNVEVDARRDQHANADPNAAMRSVSLMFVQPPKPKEFAIHDLVTIIVDETSRSESEQRLDTDKEYQIQAAMLQFPSLRHLLEMQLQNEPPNRTARLNITGEHEFKSRGNARRTDRFVARITAKVIDVKPNGTLVLEASKQVAMGREVQTIILSGSCRQEDVTSNNTVSSSQLANLTVVQQTDGDVSRATRKGLIPRVLEAIFNF